ncbi:hypothetical protein CYMTET_23351, partial [Cymbomonas tetramitiformis]
SPCPGPPARRIPLAQGFLLGAPPLPRASCSAQSPCPGPPARRTALPGPPPAPRGAAAQGDQGECSRQHHPVKRGAAVPPALASSKQV